jgi:hypothetical protein
MRIIYPKQFLLRLIVEISDKGCVIDLKNAAYKFSMYVAGY